MRVPTFVLLLAVAACREKDPYANAAAHPGEPTVQPRSAPVDSLPREARFLARMLGHQETLGRLLSDAAPRVLSIRTRMRVEEAARQRHRYQADLRAAGERYPGLARATNPPSGDVADELKELQGSDYEKALVHALLANYRAEISDIDSFLPHLNADVKGLAKEMRSQRRHEIQRLTRPD